MNHAEVMLKNAKVCIRYLKALDEQSKELAVKSYCTEGVRDGTMGQVAKLVQFSVAKESCESFLRVIRSALKDMPKGYRALLYAVYVKGVTKRSIAEKFGISIATVYRKVRDAVGCFGDKLVRNGKNEAWFVENYGNADWISDLISQTGMSAFVQQ